MRISIVLAVIVLLFMSCGVGRKKEEVVIEGRYKMKVPTTMSAVTDLNDEASLQFQNIFKELYLIVIDEDISEFNISIVDNGIDDVYSQDLDGYCNLLIDVFTEDVVTSNQTEFIDLTINGLSARQIEIDGEVDGIPVYYCYTFIEGEKNFYQILSWTLLEKKEEHTKMLKKMPLSFEEL